MMFTCIYTWMLTSEYMLALSDAEPGYLIFRIRLRLGISDIRSIL